MKEKRTIKRRIKKPRARSPEKKAAKFEKILDGGIELFVKYGTHGFSMRALAKQLDMTQANLYNYVQSKRELWMAIRMKYCKQYNESLDKIFNDNKDSYFNFFSKWVEFFLEFASVDFARFQIMYLISAPSSKKVGPFEEKYRPIPVIEFGIIETSKALKEKKIKNIDATKIFYYLFGLVIGIATVEANLNLEPKITEPISLFSIKLTPQEYRVFALNRIKKELKTLLNELD